MRLIDKLKNNFPKDRRTHIILAVALVLALGGAFLGFRVGRLVIAENVTFALPGDPVVSRPAPAEGDDPDDLPELILGADLPTPDPWDGTSRVNMLVMGLDYRDWEAGDTPRTDTMMVLTFDPLNNTAGMISIPRDLWVPIPGFEYNKINTAYYLGEVYNLPGGGPGLAARTVQELLGVPIHFYAQVDFQAFVDFIDHIDGVKVTIDEPLLLDRRGRWNSRTLEPGTYTLNGEFALAFARVRTSEGGDFDRASRQQYLIMRIRDRILEFDMMPKLVANAPLIYSDLSSGLNTNMSLNDAIRLGWSATSVDREMITHVVISNEYITLAKSEDGLDILRPVPDKIRLLRDEVFGGGDSLGPVAEGDITEIIAEEAARVSVRNASNQAGLAARTADYMRGFGFNIVEESNAEYSASSQVYQYNGTPYALRWVAETMGITVNQIHHNFEPNGSFDLVIVLGDDWALNNPMP